MTDLYGNIPISGDHKKPDQPSTTKKVKKSPRSPSPKDKEPKTGGKSKYLIVPAVITILLISYYGLTTLFVPLYIEKKFPALFQDKTGLSLVLGSVNFNPLKSALIIEDVAISTLSLNSEKDHLLNIKTVYIDFDLTSLINHGYVAESLLLKGASLTITKYDDSTYNISRFLPQDSTPSSAFVNLSKVPFLYSLNNIVVSESEILFEDIATKKTHRIEDIQLSLPKLGNFSYTADKYIQPGFSAIINGSPVRLTSDAPYSDTGNSDNSSKLSLSLQSVDLPLYASYIPAQLPVVVKQGRADIEMEIAFKAQQNEDFHLNLDYQIQIEKGIFESYDQAIILETPALRLEGSIMPLLQRIKMQNVLFRDPVVTIKDSVSAATMASLFLQNANPGESNEDFLRFAALDVALLIADNGKCIIKSKDTERIFHPVQLSIKNFANAKSQSHNPADQGNRSFRLSGESESDRTTFSWQGSFNKTTPVGTLDISHLPINDFLELLVPAADLKGEGTADIHGKLSVKRSTQSLLHIDFQQADVQLSSFTIKKDGKSLLQSSKAKLAPFQIDENTINLGNTFLEDATLQVDSNTHILTDILSKNNNSLQGIDFKGTIIVGQSNGQDELRMENVHLQINDLEKSKNNGENFAFSANVNKSGSLNAKGSLSISPLTGTIELAIAAVPASILFSADDKTFSLAPTTMINAAGKYDFSSQMFAGKAQLSAGELRDSRTKKRYVFDKAVFDQFSLDRKTKKYSGKNIVFKDFAATDDSFILKADGVSVSSFTMAEKTSVIDSLEFSNTDITCKKDCSALFSFLQGDEKSNLNIANMHIQGSISTADDSQQKTPYIDQFDLTLNSPASEAAKKKDFDIKAHFVDQGSLSANGGMQYQPLQIQIAIQLDQASSEILSYFPSSFSQSQLTAKMSGKINFGYPENTFTGNIQFSDGYIADTSDKPLFSWQKAELQNFQLNNSPLALEAEKLFLNSPRTVFTRGTAPIFSEIKQNVNEYFQKLNDQAKNTADQKISIKRVDIANGIVDYIIPDISPSWQLDLTSVNGYMNNFNVSEANDAIEYSLQGRAGGGNFSISGIDSSALNGLDNSISFELKAFPLMLFEEQLNSLFDLRFTESTVDISFNKQNSADDYSANISLTSPEIKDYRSPSALTLALISESSDKLSLTIPLKNSSQPLYNQVTNYFQRLIVKCSVSPYLLLEWPYDTLRSRNSISFEPGKTELTLDSRDTLLDYSTLLEKHPQLQLKLETTVQRSADTRALRAILTDAERQRVEQENDRLLQEWQQQKIDTEASAAPNDGIAERDLSEQNLAEFTPIAPKDIVVTEKMLTQLGLDRANQIRKYILDQSSISENNIAEDVDVSLINTLDMPEVSIRLLGHIGQK